VDIRILWLLIIVIAPLVASCAVVNVPFAVVDRATAPRAISENILEATFSPSGKYILATVKQGLYQHLHLISADGKTHRQLTTGKRHDFYPSFSPDGDYVVFSSAVGQRRAKRKFADIYLLRVDEQEPERLTSTPFGDYRPKVNHSGTHVVFEGDNHLHSLSLNDKNVTQITSSEGRETYPLLLKGSDEILFWRAHWYGHNSPIARELWHNYRLYRTTLDGKEIQPVMPKEYYNLNQVVVNSDGTLAMFDTGFSEWKLLYLSDPVRLAPLAPRGNSYSGVRPDYSGGRADRVMHYCKFSPDGKSILFVSSKNVGFIGADGKSMDLHMLDLETLEARQLSTLEINIAYPEFSPTGDKILFLVDPHPWDATYRYQLWVINADGTHARQLKFGSENLE
jgi:Tol biopolymer transport system component